MTLGPGPLADLLAALPVCVQAVEVQRRAVVVDDYAGGPRPSSVVLLSGLGQVGRGENVAFTEDEQARFATRASSLLRAGAHADGAWRGRVDTLVDQTAGGYERAALEAALLDLALRQAGTTLAVLAGPRERSMRVVVSFAARRDPAAYVRELRAAGRARAPQAVKTDVMTGPVRGAPAAPQVELKIDVDPHWDAAAATALAAEPGVAVLDFKGRGDAPLAALLSPLFPGALFEDPPEGTTHPRRARDATLPDTAAVATALSRGEAVNLKAPRMGGPLEVLHALALVPQAGPDSVCVAYLGGMFEVDVGRTQARQLAALFCPDGPNDLAPLRGPLTGRISVALDTPGFG